MELVKSILGGAALCEARDRFTRLRTPAIRGSKEASDILKLTCHAGTKLTTESTNIHAAFTDVNDAGD